MNKQTTWSINYLQLKKASRIDWLSLLSIYQVNEGKKMIVKSIHASIKKFKSAKNIIKTVIEARDVLKKSSLWNKKGIIYEKWQNILENEVARFQFKNFVKKLDKILKQAKYKYALDEWWA